MKKLVIFSGAGISAESGINTFRDHDGLWEKHAINKVATPEAWRDNPALVQRFYNERRKQILAAQPNRAHYDIAQLQDFFECSVITQNIDDLHERAGSNHVLHLHGNIRLAKSSAPQQNTIEHYYRIDGWQLDIDQDFCPDGYPLRPHVVWFGEAVPEYANAVSIVQQADIFIVIGSSLTVYPVAGLVNEIPAHCQAFYLDPNAQQIPIPRQYQCLNMTACAGMHYLKQVLVKDLTP